MNFTFTEDQLLFQESVRDFLVNEVTAESIRALWEADTGRSDALWQQLTELGLTAMTVPEAMGGLGMTALDFILIAQECGYVALPAPLVHIALVAVPLLDQLSGDSGEAIKQQWLPAIAEGRAKVMVGLEQNVFVEDAHTADLLILQKGQALYALTREQFSYTLNESVDPSRKLYSISWQTSDANLIAEGGQAQCLIDGAMNRGALGVAAEALGLSQRMVDMTVSYTADRQQFGKPIGSFQAVKHLMANVAVKLEFAKTPVYKAAYAVAEQLPSANVNVSHAKLAATEVAQLAARNTMQCHGAMGYTWEVDLQIFMKKAWVYNNAWGVVAWHQGRVSDFVFADQAAIGAGSTFVA